MREDISYFTGQPYQDGRDLSNNRMVIDRDEGLALFQDIRTRGKNNLLYPSSADDIDESLSMKLGSFSSSKPSASTPAQRKTSDLLYTDLEKNDYDWLMTPPGTPLFPSLDQETPLVNIPQGGTLGAQHISTSRTSRSSPGRTRRSSSPYNSCPVSCSSGIDSYLRNGTLSTPSSMTARSSTPKSGSSTPLSSSSTLMFQGYGPGSSGHSSSVGKGGPSLGKMRHGGSSSPKLQAWQSNIPGFPYEPPPNLRTTLSDRMISHTRGSSQAPRCRGETGSRSRHRSASPFSSSTSTWSNHHDCNPFLSQSKGRAVSLCEDKADPIQCSSLAKKGSSPEIVVGCRPTRKQVSCPNSVLRSLSKRPARSTLIPNASGGFVPKRSFHSADRQMSLHQKSQRMFRPLLSSAPATSFHTNNTNKFQCQTNTINSSVTTSGNGSYKHASIAPGIEITVQDDEDIESKVKKSLFSHGKDKILVFNKMEVNDHDIGNHFSGYDSQQSKDNDCHELGSTSEAEGRHCDTHIIRDTDNLQHGKVLPNMNVKNLPGVIGGSWSDCYKNVHTGYTQHSYQGPNTFEGRDLCLDCQRSKTVFNDSADPSGSHGTGAFESRVSSELHQKEVTLKCNNTTAVQLQNCASPKFGVSKHAVAATEGPRNVHQGGNSDRCLGKIAIPHLQDNSLVKYMDAKMNHRIVLEMSSQKANWLTNDVSTLEMQDPGYSCPQNCEFSGNSGYSHFEKIKGSAVEQASVGPAEQEKECETGDRGLLTIRFDECIKASADMGDSDDYLSALESNLGDINHENNKNSQNEAISSTVNSSNMETETEASVSAILEGHNQSKDVEKKRHNPDEDKDERAYVSQGESVNINVPRGYLLRSTTLEEATDTVLFCSSIVHNVVYKAATIAIEKENLVITPIPTVTILGMSQARCRNASSRTASWHTLRYQTTNSRQTVAQLHTPFNRIETTLKDQPSVMHVTVGERNEPPKPNNVSSKCCCTVM